MEDGQKIPGGGSYSSVRHRISCLQIQEMSKYLATVQLILFVRTRPHQFFSDLLPLNITRIDVKNIAGIPMEYASSRVRRISSVAISSLVKESRKSVSVVNLSLSDKRTYQSPNSISRSLRCNSCTHGIRSNVENLLA